MLTFIETPIFTKQIKSLIDDNSYAELQKKSQVNLKKVILSVQVVVFVKFDGIKMAWVRVAVFG